MRVSGLLRYAPRKRYILDAVNGLQKPYWEYTGAQLVGKDTNKQGGPWEEKAPRLAPHLNPRGLVESFPREMEDMSDYFNPLLHENGDIDGTQSRDIFDDMKFFAKRYSLIAQRRTCSSDIHNPKNRDVWDIWLRDVKGKSEKSQLHSGGKVDIELLGQIDFQPNIYNEKVISMDIDKILYYIGLGVSVSTEVGEILGIFGYLPVHPSTELRLMKFHETRRNMARDDSPMLAMGGYRGFAESEVANMIAGKNVIEDTFERRREMVKARVELRKRREAGIEDTKESAEVDYDTDDDDDF